MRPSFLLMKAWSARAPQAENNVPFKVQLPLQLKNRVSSKGIRGKERGCLYEISLVLSCMQQHNFENKLCTKEIETFHQCYANYLTKNIATKEDVRKGVLTPYSKNLRYNQVNLLMRKYPHV